MRSAIALAIARVAENSITKVWREIQMKTKVY